METRRGHHRRLQRPRARRAAIDAGDRPQDRRRASACASRISTTRSTTRSRSGRFRSSTPSATSTWWCWRSIRNSRAIPSNLERIFVAGANDAQVPLSAVVRYRARPVAARGLSLAVVSLDDGVVQPAARRAAGGRDHQYPARGRRTAHAGRHPRQFRRQCRRLQQDQRPAAAADPRRAGGDVYRARRALREPRASADDHLDAAVGRARRAAGAADHQHAADRDRLCRHHPADRHRQEERHHDGGFRARRRAPPRPVVGGRDLRGLQRALPADPDDDDGGPVRRHSAGHRDRAGHRTAPAARHHHHRRAVRVADPDAVHDAGDLPADRPAAAAMVRTGRIQAPAE